MELAGVKAVIFSGKVHVDSVSERQEIFQRKPERCINILPM